jgi:fructuronate reductase
VAAGGCPVNRLSSATLLQVDGDAVQLPATAWAAQSVGILHLGIGAFHRAHQAVFTEDACVASGSTDWGICGVSQRSANVVDQLRPQNGLYGVLERSADSARLRVVGSVRDVLFAATEPARLSEKFVDPAVRIVSMTVTEKGYRRNRTGHLDLADPLVREDLSSGSGRTASGSGRTGFGSGRTAVGQVVRGLQTRMAANGAPVTVLSCDNLCDNGAVIRQLVMDFCAALPDAEAGPLVDWIGSSVTFPSTMVDRIVPATTAPDRADARRMLGLSDEGLVVAEPFKQWVIEDHFAAGRPAWELARVEMTADVAPYEAMKLRLLNGTHSMLAYLGALAGYETIAEAVRDDELADAATRLMQEDVLPTLAGPEGTDLAAYSREVLDRFANPALQHRTVQVAMDGSQKLPLRLLGTIQDRLRAGAVPVWACRAVAGWMVYISAGHDRMGRPLPLDDPLAERLREAAGTGTGAGASGLVDGLLSVREVFTPELAESAALRDTLVLHVEELLASLSRVRYSIDRSVG